MAVSSAATAAEETTINRRIEPGDKPSALVVVFVGGPTLRPHGVRLSRPGLAVCQDGHVVALRKRGRYDGERVATAVLVCWNKSAGPCHDRSYALPASTVCVKDDALSLRSI